MRSASRRAATLLCEEVSGGLDVEHAVCVAFGSRCGKHTPRHGKDSHLAGIYAGDPLAMPISSSQLISRGVAAARVHGRVARVLVEVREAGHWRRMLGRGFGRWAHSNGLRGSGTLRRAGYSSSGGRLVWCRAGGGVEV